MNVLVVVESLFGNTAAVADALADGLRTSGAEVTVVAASTMPHARDADLVCVGAPTHNRGLPSPRSRRSAAARGAPMPESGVPDSGVSEWLAAQHRLDVRAVAFDTAVAGYFAGSAATRIARRLRAAGADVVARESYVVAGSPASLRPGETERARAWGREIAAQVVTNPAN